MAALLFSQYAAAAQYESITKFEEKIKDFCQNNQTDEIQEKINQAPKLSLHISVKNLAGSHLDDADSDIKADENKPCYLSILAYVLQKPALAFDAALDGFLTDFNKNKKHYRNLLINIAKERRKNEEGLANSILLKLSEKHKHLNDNTKEMEINNIIKDLKDNEPIESVITQWNSMRKNRRAAQEQNCNTFDPFTGFLLLPLYAISNYIIPLQDHLLGIIDMILTQEALPQE